MGLILFSDVYALCVANPDPYAERLYLATKDWLEMHVRDLCVRVTQQGMVCDGGLIQAYYQAWTEYSRGVTYLTSLYSYLNLQHIKKQQFHEVAMHFGNEDSHEQLPPLEIGDLGLEMWKQHMVEALREKLVRLILEHIEVSFCLPLHRIIRRKN